MVNVPSADIARRKVGELIAQMKYTPNLTIPANVSVSIGFCLTNGAQFTYEELFARADEALYQAKNAGRARGQEYGVEPSAPEFQNEGCVVLLGANNATMAVVESELGQKYRLVKAQKPADALQQLEEEPVVLTYVDLSAANDAAACWREIGETACLNSAPKIAICRESDLEQYRTALEAGAVDLLSVPVDRQALRRRTERALG